MNEIVAICRAARETLARGERAVLVTVVRTVGSTYRRPGARMLFSESGRPVGFVSGGCLEADLAERARDVLASGATGTAIYDMRSPDDVVWGLGLGCGGEVRVLLERLDPPDVPPHLRFLERVVGGDPPGVLATVFDARGAAPARVGDRWYRTVEQRGEGAERLGEVVDGAVREVLGLRRTAVRTFQAGRGEVDVLLEHVAPAPTLFVFGAGRDAVPVTALAATLGFRVIVADDRPAYASAANFPAADEVRVIPRERLDRADLPIDRSSAVLVMTHHFLRDLEILALVLARPAAYVGILGPARRTELLLDELGARGLDVGAARARIRAPAGLDIGAETPEEIAVSALAEIRAVLAGRDGGPLRERDGPIHDAP
jgi:xanthine/CO dehydrogenase XdhC/CoxF family maturation factor